MQRSIVIIPVGHRVTIKRTYRPMTSGTRLWLIEGNTISGGIRWNAENDVKKKQRASRSQYNKEEIKYKSALQRQEEIFGILNMLHMSE